MSKDLQNECGRLIAMTCDITQDEEVEAVFDKINQLYGGVDICINNAGMSKSKSLLGIIVSIFIDLINKQIIIKIQ